MTLPNGRQGVANLMGNGCNQPAHLRELAFLNDFGMGYMQLLQVFGEIDIQPCDIVVDKLQCPAILTG
jgi:hypothetical protein